MISTEQYNKYEKIFCEGRNMIWMYMGYAANSSLPDSFRFHTEAINEHTYIINILHNDATVISIEFVEGIPFESMATISHHQKSHISVTGFIVSEFEILDNSLMSLLMLSL